MKKLLTGEYPGLGQPLAGERARGCNLYFPIPYAKHCKVTSDKGDFYYHVNYRTYEKGTPVLSFSADDIVKLSAAIKDLASRLAVPRDANKPWPKDMVKDLFDSFLAPGETKTLNEVAGPRAYNRILLFIAADDLEVAPRNIVLKMYFDGKQTVESPLGDFFGTAPGLNRYESLASGLSGPPLHMWSHWIMPFSKQARITVTNMGDKVVRVHGSASHVPYKWTEDSLLFHAKWRIERDIPTRPFIDWTHLECQGRGRFVGGALHLTNPQRGWWGEGDEKIYVDDETFPSHFGTGTEDYYGYAWGSEELFSHAYHNQPRCDGPRRYGNTSLNRWHILDDIPFNKRFKFDIENWSWITNVKMARAAVSYWYARPGGSDFFKPISKKDVELTKLQLYPEHVAEGAIDAETMKVVEKTGDVFTGEADERYTGRKQFVWSNAKGGDKLVLAFNSTDAGNRQLLVRLTKCPHCPKVRFYFNGQKIDKVINLMHKETQPTNKINLGQHQIKKGQNLLAVEIIPDAKAPDKTYSFGMDYVILK